MNFYDCLRILKILKIRKFLRILPHKLTNSQPMTSTQPLKLARNMHKFLAYVTSV